jgi:hypothetical protein
MLIFFPAKSGVGLVLITTLTGCFSIYNLQIIDLNLGFWGFGVLGFWAIKKAD